MGPNSCKFGAYDFVDTKTMLKSLQTVLNFIFKKTLLAFTIPFPMPIAMLMAGYWIEHLTDLVCWPRYRQQPRQ
jgi:hypothetical protein